MDSNSRVKKTQANYGKARVFMVEILFVDRFFLPSEKN